MNTPDPNLQKIEDALDAMRRATVNALRGLGEGLNLTRSQLEILFILAKTSQTTGELARRLSLTQSAVTQTIATLVDRDLIARHPSELDRRIIHLELSPAGRKITDHLRELRHKNMQALAAELSDSEINAFVSATQKLTALLNETIAASIRK